MLNPFARSLVVAGLCVAVTGCHSTNLWQNKSLLKKAGDCAPDGPGCAPGKEGCGPGDADCVPDKLDLTLKDSKLFGKDKMLFDNDKALFDKDLFDKDKALFGKDWMAGCRAGKCGWQGGGPCPSGCGPEGQCCDFGLPRELKKVSLPDYVIEPPDILLIEVDGSRKTPTAELSSGELLEVRVGNTLPVDQFDDEVSRGFKTINGVYRIQSDGQIDLGPEYGKVAVRGLAMSEARRLIELHLKRTLKNPRVLVARATEQSEQQIAGEHLVRPDGTVSLGIHGSVYVAGLTLSQAHGAIQRHLSARLSDPRVNLDILAYNSKVYYVVTDGGGAGEQVFRFPCTGNETVLDALAQINGLPTVASKKDIWIARPAPPSTGRDQVLDVDWNAIVRGAQTSTNYQILPGDRVYVQADPLITFDTGLAKLAAPFERMLGFVLLGNGTIRAVDGQQQGGGGGGF